MVAVLGAALLAVPVAARAQVSVLTPMVEEREARPGEAYTGAIRLLNSSSEPQEVKLYLTDYVFHADGRSEYGEPGSEARSNARWLTVNPAYLVLPPKTEQPVHYTVAVPSAAPAPLVGSYWSMVMVEVIPPGSVESSRAPADPKKQELGVRTAIRYGVQVVTHIGATGEHALEITGTQAITEPGGARALRFDVVNTGERAYRPRISVEVYDQTGAAVAKEASERGLLYPGTSLRQEFRLGTLAAGTYKALVVVDTGGDQVFGGQFTLQF